MKTNILKTLTLATIFAISLAACDKNNRASKRLIKPGLWNVVELSVNGQEITPYPVWSISDCDIYEDTCTAIWYDNSLDTESQIYWQFNDKAETFTISRVVDTADCEDFYTEEVEQQTFRFSGEYSVIERKRKEMHFESSNTLGYPNEEVVIRLERRE
jgi:hypothetical protein